MAEQEAVREKDERTVKMDCREDVQRLARFKDDKLAFLKVLKEAESVRDGYPGRTNVAKHRVDLLNDDPRSVNSTSYWAEPRTKKVPVAIIGRMIEEKVVVSATTERRA